MFNLFKPFDLFRIGSNSTVEYNPLINYDWSTTTTNGLRYLKDVGSTPTYNASMYFGRGAYLNGVDQSITVPINTTIQTALKRVNGVVTINETSQALTNYVISGLGVHKDYYLFTRLLTTAEKDSYTNTPELFYAMAQADDTCVLNMPMCENSSTSRNYKTGIDYPITNYTTSVRDNAKKLRYGLQTCKFVRDGLGVIQSASNYLECDGVGYADTGWIPSVSEDWTITCFFNNNMNSTIETFGVYADNTENRMFIQKHSNNSVRAYVGNTGSGYIYSGAGLTKVTIIYKASTKSGKFIINKTNIIPYTNLNFLGCISPFYLAVSSRNSSSYNTYYYTGSNYKFRLDNKVLTDDEIQIIQSEGI